MNFREFYQRSINESNDYTDPDYDWYGSDPDEPDRKYTPKSKNALKMEIKRVVRKYGDYSDLSYIDTRLITDMSNLFDHVPYFGGNISKWNMSKVTDISGMLKGLASFKQDISKWDLSKVKNHEDAFTGSGIESKAKKWFPDFFE